MLSALVLSSVLLGQWPPGEYIQVQILGRHKDLDHRWGSCAATNFTLGTSIVNGPTYFFLDDLIYGKKVNCRRYSNTDTSAVYVGTLPVAGQDGTGLIGYVRPIVYVYKDQYTGVITWGAELTDARLYAFKPGTNPPQVWWYRPYDSPDYWTAAKRAAWELASVFPLPATNELGMDFTLTQGGGSEPPVNPDDPFFDPDPATPDAGSVTWSLDQSAAWYVQWSYNSVSHQVTFTGPTETDPGVLQSTDPPDEVLAGMIEYLMEDPGIEGFDQDCLVSLLFADGGRLSTAALDVLWAGLAAGGEPGTGGASQAEIEQAIKDAWTNKIRSEARDDLGYKLDDMLYRLGEGWEPSPGNLPSNRQTDFGTGGLLGPEKAVNGPSIYWFPIGQELPEITGDSFSVTLPAVGEWIPSKSVSLTSISSELGTAGSTLESIQSVVLNLVLLLTGMSVIAAIWRTLINF